MNTEDARSDLIAELDGTNFKRLAELVEAHDGPLLKHQNGQVLQGIASGISEQEEAVLSDEELLHLISLLRTN